MRETLVIKNKIGSFAYGGQEIPRSPEVVSWALSRDNHINSRLRAENQ